jgi:hypothetical protein
VGESEISVSQLPRATRLVVCVYALSSLDQGGKELVGFTVTPVFDEAGWLLQGRRALRLWPTPPPAADREDSETFRELPASSQSAASLVAEATEGGELEEEDVAALVRTVQHDNSVTPQAAVVHLAFDRYNAAVIFLADSRSASSAPSAAPIPSPAARTALAAQTMPLSAKQQERLEQLVARDPLCALNAEDSDLVWQGRA